jgi:cytochrome P450
VAESIRLYPPAWAISRLNKQQVRIYNTIVPPNSILVVSPFVMHRDPRYWKDPEQFDPDRFAPDAKKNRPRFAYFPFGGGPRVCLGERFAWMEAILVVATIARKWRLRLAPGQLIDTRPQLTLRPRYGMKMTLEQRTI